MLCSVSLQLRVVRAFRSTLDELEDKRSVHSFQSIHSMRSSRSHQGHRPLSDELMNPTDISAKTPSPGAEAANGSYQYTNMGLVIHENRMFGEGVSRRTSKEGGGRRASAKSRSAENVALLDSAGAPSLVVHGADSSSSRTLSSNDLNLHCNETSI